MRIIGVFISFLWAISASSNVTQLTEDPAWPYCEETVEFYEINQDTPLGFSGSTLLDLTSNINAVKINYGYKTDQTVGSFIFSQITSIARYVRSKAIYPAQGYNIGITCTDRVELDVNVTFVSQDGAFMDSWDTTLRSEEPRRLNGRPKAGEYAKFSIYLGPEDFRGSFYKDSSEEWLGGVLSGKITPNELSAEIGHTTCTCDHATCMTSLVVDLAIDSFIPYEN